MCPLKGGMINHALVLALLIKVSGYLDEKMLCSRTQYGFNKGQGQVSLLLVNRDKDKMQKDNLM